MAYIKNNWVDREGTTRYHETVDEDGALIFTPDYEKVTEIGTPVNADNMNHIEEGIEDHENRITVLEEAGDVSNFLNTSQITNCLLEVPQKINIELLDGTLTLKAGSTVIVPNGFYDNGDKKFDYVTTTKDLSITPSTSFATGSYFITCNINGSYLSQGTVSGAISGETEPTMAHALWYNTTDNIIDRTGSDIALYNQKFSFPIAVVQAVNGTAAWTSIDQVLNGFGYIGNHIWCDKGVKGLIPNGRNTDGSLNNIEYTQQYIKTEYCGNNQNFIEGIGTGITQSNYYVEQEEEPTTNYTLWYKPSENKMYRKSGSGVVTVNNVFVGLEVTTGEGYITEFKPRQVFRAMDWNDMRINHPYFFGQYIWSEFAPNNLSWLKSVGQWNSGYTSFYQWVLDNVNNGKSGFKLSTASYTDYDFVVNTTDKTFRLPIKVKGRMGEAVVGNGMTLGLTNGDGINGALAGSGSGNYYAVGLVTTGFGQNLPFTDSTTNSNIAGQKIGVTTDPTKSGLEVDTTGLSLYFYVGETIKDLALIGARGVINNVIVDNSSSIAGYSMPSGKYTDLTLGASTTEYTAPANGYFFLSKTAKASGQYAYFENTSNNLSTEYTTSSSTGTAKIYIPVKKGDKVKLEYNLTGTTNYFRFVYAQGEV